MKKRLTVSGGLMLAVIIAVGIGMQANNLLISGLIAIVIGAIAALILTRVENALPPDVPVQETPDSDIP